MTALLRLALLILAGSSCACDTTVLQTLGVRLRRFIGLVVSLRDDTTPGWRIGLGCKKLEARIDPKIAALDRSCKTVDDCEEFSPAKYTSLSGDSTTRSLVITKR